MTGRSGRFLALPWGSVVETWLLGQDDVGRVLRVLGRDTVMRRVIDALRAALADLGRGVLAPSPPRTGFTRGGAVPGVIEVMPHRQPGRGVTVKTVAYSPRNARRAGLPTILGTVARLDDDTGHLVALADGVLLTALRTGAASAVATSLLAHPGATTLGLVGAGAQAVTQAHGLAQVLDLRRVLVSDTDPAHAAGLAARIAFLGLDVRVAAPAEVLAGADVLCTATSVEPGRGPVFPDGPHREHLHVNAVGADEPGKTELPLSLLRRARVCVDHPEQAHAEGESQRLAPGEVAATLDRLCADPAAAEGWRHGLTVFDSTGFALEDHVALDVLLAAAEELGLGTKVAIEHLPEDVLDPYATRRATTDHYGQSTVVDE
ncbi:alanine dehydrogenase [Actinokineospora spheciospongiae]|nr:alanine dehydrogenase [Actinokineospora spheciospongiae]